MASLRTILLLAAALLVLGCNFVASQQPTPLTLGTPAQGTVANGQWVYYSLDVSQAPQTLDSTEKLIFIVTPFSGDADIYVGNLADPTNWLWNSTLYGTGDYISLTSSTILQNASYSIGILGASTPAPSTASFSILAYKATSNTSDPAVITLTDGIPQMARGSSKSFTYFTFNLADASNFTISVTPLYGDPDVYVSIGQKPTLTKYQWRSQSYGFDLLDIISTQQNYQPGATYTIGIYAFTSSLFSIAAVKKQTTARLIENIPFNEDLITGEFVYFTYTLTSSSRLTFAVTPLGNGDPDIYVTTSNAAPPGPNNYIWTGRAQGKDIVNILTTDSHFTVGTYYIGIHGFSGVIFSLLAYTEADQYVNLIEGVPQNDDVDTASQPRIYKFTHGDAQSGALVTVTMTSGSANLYYSLTNPRPGPDKSDGYKTDIYPVGVLYWPTPAKTGSYYVSVYPTGSSANYTIIYSTNQTIQTLVPGKLSYANEVPQGYYRYFTFVNDGSNSDIAVTVKPFTGDADVYMSLDPVIPNKKNYTWRANRVGADVLVADNSDPNYCNNCRYNIAVYGFTQAWFAIMVQLSADEIELADGVATPGFVAPTGYTYYHYKLPIAGEISISLTLAPGSPSSADPDIFVSKTKKPTNMNYQWRSINFGADYVTISPASVGDYYIGVYGNYQNASYVLTVTANYLALIEGQQFIDAVAQKQYRYYKIQVPSFATSIMISSTLIYGSTEMYVSVNGTKPTRYSFDYNSFSWPGNAIYANISDGKFLPGTTWYVGIMGHKASDYFITYQIMSATLQPGAPSLGYIPAAQIGGPRPVAHYRYYVPYDYSSRAVANDQVVNIVTTNGSAIVLVWQKTDGSFPTLDNMNDANVWSQTSQANTGTSFAKLTIPKGSLKSGFIQISVFSLSSDIPATFQVSASAANAPMFLGQEQELRQTTPTTNPGYFQVLSTPATNQQLIVRVDSCLQTEAPAFYVSKTVQQPNASAYDFMANQHSEYKTTTYLITNAQNNTRYYIGVHPGADPTAYAITAVTGEDSRPIPGNNGKFGGTFDKKRNIFNLEIPSASGNILNTPYYYYVYYTNVNYFQKRLTIKEIPNLFTVCGAEYFGTLAGAPVKQMNPSKQPTITFPMNCGPKSDYIVNVVVQDALGMKSAYTPIFIEDGKIIDPFPHSTFVFSLGLFIIITSIICIALYLMIGSGIKLVKGARGLEAIPNIDFWRSLPGLVWDGVKFTFTCGRSAVSYEMLDEEQGGRVSVNTSGFEAVSSSGSAGPVQTSGYGAIRQ